MANGSRENAAPSARARPAAAANSRDALLDAAIGLLAERGPHGVSSREVAKRAGVNYGLVHYYFETKNALLAQAMQRELDRYHEQLQSSGKWRARTLENPPSDTMLRAVFHLALEWDEYGATFEQSPVETERLEHLRELYGNDVDELRLLAAYSASTCLQMGWLVLAPQQLAAANASPKEGAKIRDFIEEVVLAILPLACRSAPPKPSPSRRRRPARTTRKPAPLVPDARRALLDAAIALLAEHGPHGVSSREVAKRAGVNYGLVHYYFESKTEMFGQALKRELLRYENATVLNGEWQASLVEHPPSEIALRAFFHLALDWAEYAPAFDGFTSIANARMAHLRELYGPDVDELRLRSAYIASICLQLGWLVLGPQQLAAAKATRAQGAQMRAFIVEVDRAILPLALAD